MTQKMTMDEILTYKRRIEDEILNLVTSFATESGLNVEHVHLSAITVHDLDSERARMQLTGVRLDVRLP